MHVLHIWWNAGCIYVRHKPGWRRDGKIPYGYVPGLSVLLSVWWIYDSKEAELIVG